MVRSDNVRSTRGFSLLHFRTGDATVGYLTVGGASVLFQAAYLWVTEGCRWMPPRWVYFLFVLYALFCSHAVAYPGGGQEAYGLLLQLQTHLCSKAEKEQHSRCYQQYELFQMPQAIYPWSPKGSLGPWSSIRPFVTLTRAP